MRIVDLDKLKAFDQKPNFRRCESGLGLLHIPLDNDPRLYLGVTIAAGSRYENKDALGAAHFLEHMMFRGSKNYPSFRSLSKAFEWLGGEWNAATGHEHTEYWFSGNASSWKQAVELFADFFCNPKLNDLDIEREVIKKELQKEQNDHGNSTDLEYLNLKQMFAHSSLARPILGTQNSIEHMSLKAIKEYRDKNYHPSKMIICVVGGPVEVLDQLEKSFSKYRKSKASSKKKNFNLPKFKGPLYSFTEHSDNEYQVQLSFKSYPEWSKGAFASALVCRILADGYFSRLGARLRETLGLVYSVDANMSLYSDHGSLDILASVGPGELKKFTKELLNILGKLRDRGPQKTELELAKTRALYDLELLPADPELLGFRWSWALLSNKNPNLSHYAKTIENIDYEYICRLCKKMLTPQNASLVLLGPKDDQLETSIQALYLADW